MSTPRRPRLAPVLCRLEGRDVPANFYVDPLFAVNTAGDTVTFNDFGPGAVAGLTVGTDAFATLNDALTAAAANTESDKIFLARSRVDVDGGAVAGDDLFPEVTPLDNSAGPILIDDNITLIGSGRGATILAPTDDTADEFTGVFEVAAGKSFFVRDLSFDGSGKQIGIGFSFNDNGVSGKLARVEVTNIAFGAVDGAAVAAGNKAILDVTDSQISGYGRIGVSYANANGTVSGTTITGKGAGTTFVNYGLQIAGSSAVVVTGNTITGNTASVPANFELSAGVNLFEFGGAAPTATLTKNTITGNTFGVLVGGEYLVDRSQASIRSNNLDGNYLAIQADNDNVVDAVNNWYGDATGPFVLGANPTGKGSEVTDQVTFSPWLTAPFVDTVEVPGPVVTVPVPVPGPVVTVPVPVPQPIVTPPPAGLAAGGSGQLVGLNETLATALATRPFGAGYLGEVRVARADVTGDGVADYIAAAGAGGGPRVLVFDGATGVMVRDFFAFDPLYAGGVTVAAGSVDKRRDPGFTFAPGQSDTAAYDEIIVGAASVAPLVRVYSVWEGGATLEQSFFAYPPTIGQGVTVAAGPSDGVRGAEIYVNLIGTSVLRVIDGETNEVVGQTFAYPAQFTRVLNMATGFYSNTTAQPAGATVPPFGFYDPTDDSFYFSIFGSENPDFSIQDLVAVAGDGPFSLQPRLFTGSGLTPAPLNGP